MQNTQRMEKIHTIKTYKWMFFTQVLSYETDWL